MKKLIKIIITLGILLLLIPNLVISKEKNDPNNIIKIGHVKVNKKLFKTEGNLKEKIKTCARCHGKNGNGDFDFPAKYYLGTPALRGQNKDYLEHQLKDYQKKTRKNPEMEIMVSLLQKKDIELLANYYANLPTKTPVLPKESKKYSIEQLKRGQIFANKGRVNNPSLACINCHQSKGIGLGETFPRIAGQSAKYIKKQINNWKNGFRNDEDDMAMRKVAKELTNQEIEDVSGYFESLIQYKPVKYKPKKKK